MQGLRVVAISIGTIAIGAVFGATLASAQERTLPLPVLRSGITFAGSDVRAMQADDAANPGFLWVESGEKLWNATAGSAGWAIVRPRAASKSRQNLTSSSYPAGPIRATSSTRYCFPPVSITAYMVLRVTLQVAGATGARRCLGD